MKKTVIIVVALVVAAPLVGSAVVFLNSQRADYAWNPMVSAPTFTTAHPRVVIDEAHYNASTASVASRYWPFARLLEADGYDVRKGKDTFSPESLDGVQVLVVANAAGAAKPQFFGINLPIPTKGERGDPAFTADEIETVRAWVEEGGSLLLIADHNPFGGASKALAAAFGVIMNDGFVDVPDEPSDPLLFSTENGRLGDHPILAGESHRTVVERVMTFTGQSLDGPPEASVLLKLPESAEEYVRQGSELTPQPAGSAQGLALEWKKGRVVILGEAAMMTAQVYKGVTFGMNSPGNDNRQFALNTMHWLSRTL
jgi:hypothetical protein